MKFKNKDEYTEIRNGLMKDAQTLIENGDAAAATDKMTEVEALDDAWDEFTKAQANLKALNKSNKVTDIANAGGSTAEPVIVGSVALGTVQKDVELLDSDSYKTAWMHAMKGQKLSNEEVQIIGSVKEIYNMEKTTEHQLIIPTTVKKGIWKRAGEVHPVIGDLAVTFIQGDIVIIKDTSGESEADWIDEVDESVDAEFTEGEVRLTGCEISKSVTISWKLQKMNDQDYEAYLIDRLGEKVGNTIAKSLFTGKGKPSSGDTFKAQAKGVITALEAEAGTPRVLTYVDDVTYQDLTALMAKVKGVYKAGGAFYANSNMIWTKLANILDTNGRPIFMPDGIDANTVGRVFGVPVKEEDGMLENALLLGNYGKGYAFNFNETMSIYKEDHVKTRKTDYMAYGIADGDLIDTEAFCALKKQ